MANLEALLEPKNGKTQRIVAGRKNAPWESRFYVRANLRDSRPFEIEIEYALPRVIKTQVRTLAESFGGDNEFQAGLSDKSKADNLDWTDFFEVDVNRKELKAKIPKDVEGNKRKIAVKYLNKVLEALSVPLRYNQNESVLYTRNVPNLSPENIARAYSSMRSNYDRFISNGSSERSFYVAESKADNDHAVIHFAIKKPRGYITPEEIRLLENTISYLGAKFNNSPFLVVEHLATGKKVEYTRKL